jgi:hypothetical protein
LLRLRLVIREHGLYPGGVSLTAADVVVLNLLARRLLYAEVVDILLPG